MRSEFERHLKILAATHEPTTIRVHSSILKHYDLWLKDRNEESDPENSIEFIATRKISKETKANYMMVLRSYFNHQGIEIPKHLLKKPSKKSLKKTPKDKYLTFEEINKIISASNSIRDQALIRILFHSGIRINEANKLKIGDINFQAAKIKVIGSKNSPNREVRLIEPAPVLRVLKGHLLRMGIEIAKIKKEDRDRPLFQGQKGEALSTRQMQDVVTSYRPVLNKPISAHWFRHSFAVWLKTHNISINIASLLMGDTPGVVAEIYSHFSDEDIDREMDLAEGKTSNEVSRGTLDLVDEIDELKTELAAIKTESQKLAGQLDELRELVQGMIRDKVREAEKK